MTNKADFGWQTLIKSVAPPGCALAGALLTTYDRAEARLLAETLLPEWLGLSHMPGEDAREQASFSLELDACLKRLHHRIVVISSTQREEIGDEDAQVDVGLYPWIWRSIRQLTVGKTGPSVQVQHAKLWLLQWVHPENGEFLEIVISSANLTRAAFRDQIQAAWRVCLLLHPKPSKARLSAWSVLPDFMRALAVSCGDETQLERFMDLLARADCPAGISFVASVPGKHTSRAQWGAAGLSSATPPGRGAVKVSILSPFVGAWRTESLEQWCLQFDGKPEQLSLAWIEQSHPWEQSWILPAATLAQLVEAGSKMLRLSLEPGNGKPSHRFHGEHQSSDGRWSHAKLYAFQRGNSRRLLLTSANFSQAAWGKKGANGDLSIDNFELGVCIEHAHWPLGVLDAFATFDHVATRDVKLARSSRCISWAEATWDGKHIQVECLSKAAVTGEIVSRKDPLKIARWLSGKASLQSAQIRWSDTKHLPQSVVLQCADETLQLPIFDTREPAERELSFPEEVSEADLQALSDQLLLERYGGKAVTEEETDDQPKPGDGLTDGEADHGDIPNPTDGTPADTGVSDSYAVNTFVAARQMLGVVDNWSKLVAQAQKGSSAFVLEGLQRDGGLLRAAFDRKANPGKASQINGKAKDIGAQLAAVEMAIRLKHWDQ